MDNDFETMPVGTALLLRQIARDLRVEHTEQASLYEAAGERMKQSHGWRFEADEAARYAAHIRAEHLAEQIGKIEALLARCPHAPPALEAPARSIRGPR